MNRYRAVFGVVNVPATLEAVLEPQTVLPPSLEQALHQVERQNPDIIAARSRAALKDAENAIQYEASVTFISSQIKTLMSAIQGQ